MLTTNHDGSLFVATLPGQILRVQPQTGQTEELGKLSGFIRKGFRAADGDLYLATERGLYRQPAADTGRSMPVAVEEANPLLGDFKTGLCFYRGPRPLGEADVENPQIHKNSRTHFQNLRTISTGAFV